MKAVRNLQIYCMRDVYFSLENKKKTSPCKYRYGNEAVKNQLLINISDEI